MALQTTISHDSTCIHTALYLWHTELKLSWPRTLQHTDWIESGIFQLLDEPLCLLSHSRSCFRHVEVSFHKDPEFEDCCGITELLQCIYFPIKHWFCLILNSRHLYFQSRFSSVFIILKTHWFVFFRFHYYFVFLIIFNGAYFFRSTDQKSWQHFMKLTIV